MSETPSPTTEQTPVAVPARGSYRESRRIGDILRKETVGGVLLAPMAVVAVGVGIDLDRGDIGRSRLNYDAKKEK